MSPAALKSLKSTAATGAQDRRRVLIVTESPQMQAQLEAAIQSHCSFELQIEEKPAPDIVVVDVDSESDDELIHRFASWPQPPVLVLLVDDADSEWAGSMLGQTVSGVLMRSAGAAEIIATIDAASQGLLVLSRDLLPAVFPDLRVARPPARHVPLEALTPREVEVLEMLAAGLGNKDIARDLAITEHTVKYHLSSLFGKLEATNRTEAVMKAIRDGLIML